MFPVLDPGLKARIVNEVLETGLADNVKARILCSDGSYRRRPGAEDEPEVRSQVTLQGLAREAALVSGEFRLPIPSTTRRRPSGPDRAATPA
jgi:polyphosphate kinase